ncbi:MAG: tetratricopeptide repeat protein [Paracoccaceae bacterium]
MRMRSPGLVIIVSFTAILALGGCKTSQERAEAHYQSGMALLAENDIERALVEFRNVFRLDGAHQGAREAYARTQLQEGRTSEAYSQYLRLVEQYPDHLEGRAKLAEIAILDAEWDEAERHARAARDIAPDEPMVRALNALLDYRDARRADNRHAAGIAVQTGHDVLETAPGNIIARHLVIEDLLFRNNWFPALEQIDIALAQNPGDRMMHDARLRVLATLQDADALGTHLQHMAEIFPDDAEIQQAVLSWFMQTDDMSAGENFLRGLVDRAPDADAARQARFAVVQFLRLTRGDDAARAEADRLIAAGTDAAFFSGMRAAIDYEGGAQDQAIDAMQASLAQAAPGHDRRAIRTALAQMLVENGRDSEARSHVAEILAEDPSHVGALKMQAAWLIEGDDPGGAIAALRTALGQEPRDAEILLLMADAHLRDGARNLAGERLSMAVEVSGSRPDVTLRYADFLIADARLSTAESVLITGLRREPANLALLDALGSLHMVQADWARIDGVITRLHELGSPDAVTIANRLAADKLIRQNRHAESIAFLQQLIDQGDAATGAVAAIVRSHIDNGTPNDAAAFLQARLAQSPDDGDLLLLRAALHVSTGEAPQAEAIYRDLIARAPVAITPVRALYALLMNAGRNDDAAAVIEAALARHDNPAASAAALMWIKAGLLEGAGDIDGAIALYDDMYAHDSSNAIVANNLASLLSTWRDDPDALARAHAIARRLRDMDLPAFQDTYGWIEYLRGNYTDALAHLQVAADGLPDDPVVQMRLGLTLAALNRPVDARAVLERAVALAGPDPQPQLALANQTLATLPPPVDATQ